MSFSRDNLVARHPFAAKAIQLPPPLNLDVAIVLEGQGNWFLAGETYSDIENRGGASIEVENRARVLARAATCFEITSRPESSARAYSDAARLLAQQNIKPQTAGELFNRSARQHYKANEFFFRELLISS